VSATTAYFQPSTLFYRSTFLLVTIPFRSEVFQLSQNFMASATVPVATTESGSSSAALLGAAIGGGLGALALVFAAVFVIRRVLQREQPLAQREAHSPDTDDPETTFHGGGPLHASLLGTQDALTLTSDLSSEATRNIQTPARTKNPFWELSDD
jgi:hypothetical protein